MQQLCTMAKTNERKIAYDLYVNEGLTGREISKKLRIPEKTISEWVRKYNWKDIRIAKETTSDNLIVKYNELLESLLDKRLIFEKQKDKTDEQKDEHRNVIDEMSKIASIIDKLQKDNHVSLRIHIHCLERFAAYINMHDPELLTRILDHQRDYLKLIADELK